MNPDQNNPFGTNSATEPETPLQPITPQPTQTPIPESQPVLTPQLTQPVPQAEQPSKALVIVSLVFAFLPLQLVGLILAIIAKKKVSKPSSVNTMATVSIVLNSVFGIFSIIVAAGIIMAIYAGIQQAANTNQAKLATENVYTFVADYTNTHHSFPLASSDVKLATGTQLVALTAQPASPTDVEYAVCNNGLNARFGYWSYVTKTVTYVYLTSTGTTDASSNDNCIPVTQ